MICCSPVAFVAYIITDYGFSYSFVISAISIGSLSTGSAIVLIPAMLRLPVHLLFCAMSLLQCVACFLLYNFAHSKALFIVAIIIESLIENAGLGCAQAVVSTFVSDAAVSHQYLSAINASWTLATFLFLAEGYVMKVGSIWLLLQIMMALFLVLALLNACLLPRVSTNQNERVSMSEDLRILRRIRPFWFINLALLFLFMAWGYFYSSFGLWLKGLFHLSQAQFGSIAGLAEGLGNAGGILTVATFAQSGHSKGGSCRMSLQRMMLWTSLVMLLSMGAVWLMCFLQWHSAVAVYAVLGIFFYGQEACICSALILMVNIVPPLQQGRAYSFVGIIQSFTVFTAQMTVAPIYDVGGMQWESCLLLLMYVVVVLDIIYLNKLMKAPKLDDELLRINDANGEIPRYT